MENSRTRGGIFQSPFCRTKAVKEITLIGGGLAGLTLGIALRQNDVPVTLVEAGRYPRHRVCGEFISGAGAEILQALGVSELQHGSMQAAAECAFFSPKRMLMKHRLPTQALTVSRFHLDICISESPSGTGRRFT